MDSNSEDSHSAVTGDANTCLQGVMEAKERNKEHRLELQVRLPAGVKLRVKLRDEATITELKTVIEMRSGIPSDLHAFSYGNTELKDETRIGDMAIPEGSLLVLSVPSWWNKLVCSSMKGEIEQTCARVSLKMNQITREERQFVAAFIGASRGNHSLLFNLTAGRKQLNIQRTVKHSGRSLLHAAVAGGDLSCVVNILVNGGSCLIEQLDENAETPLSVAKKSNNEGIEQLLERYLEMRRKENKKLEENNVWENEDSEGLEVVIPRDTIPNSGAEEPDKEAEKEANSSAVSTAEFSKKKIANLMKCKWKKRKQNSEYSEVDKEANSHMACSVDNDQEVLNTDGGNFPEHTRSEVSHMAEGSKASALTATTTTADTTTATTPTATTPMPSTSTTNSLIPEYCSTATDVASEFDFSKVTEPPQALTDYTGRESEDKCYDSNKFNVPGVDTIEHLMIEDRRPRSNSEPLNFKPDDEETVPLPSKMDKQIKNSNRCLDEANSKVAQIAKAGIDEVASSTERLKLHRGCLPHPKFSDETPHCEEKDIVIMENVIELDKTLEKPSKHGDRQCPGEGACAVHFPSLSVQKEPDTHDIIMPTHVTTQIGNFSGRSLGPKNEREESPHEKLVRSHSRPRRVSSLKTTRDSSGLGREGIPVPHPPARRIKSTSPTIVAPHGQHIAKPEASRLS